MKLILELIAVRIKKARYLSAKYCACIQEALNKCNIISFKILEILSERAGPIKCGRNNKERISNCLMMSAIYYSSHKLMDEC